MRTGTVRIILMLLLAALHHSLSVSSSLSDLRVNGVIAPLALTSPPYRFSWQTSALQSSYHLTLLGSDGTPVYDSGIVPSSAAFVVYNSTPLAVDADFSFRVDTVQEGVPATATSTFSTFPTSLPSEAQWIGGFWLGGADSMRSSIRLSPAPVLRARLHVAGVGCFHAWLNGVHVSDELSPGWGHAPNARSVLFTYNVTELLVDGENVVALVLGSCKRGLYGGEYCAASTPWLCNAGLAVLTVEQPGGNVSVFTTNSQGGWRCAIGPIVAQHLYAGEIYDARNRIWDGWTSPGFLPEWPTCSDMNVTGMPLQLGPITPAIMPAAVRNGLLPLAGGEPVMTSDGNFLFDFSINAAVLCSLNLTGLGAPSGAVFTMTHGEVRVGFPGPFSDSAPMYRPFTSNCACPESAGSWPSPSCAANCAPQNVTYIARGNGSDGVYTPHFFYAGGRYVSLRISGWTNPPQPLPSTLVTCERLYSGGLNPLLLGVDFPTSWELRALQNITVNTHKANYVTVPSDCSHRERRGWTGDGQLTAKSGLLNFPSLAMYRHWHLSMLEQQRMGCSIGANDDRPHNWQCSLPKVANLSFADIQYGTIGDVVPQEQQGMGNWPGDPSWSVAATVVPAALMEVMGDVAWVEEGFDGVIGMIEWFTRLASAIPSSKSLFPWSELGDWKAIDAPNGTLVADFHYLLAAMQCADIAAALPGRSAEGAACVVLAGRVSAALAQVFFDVSTAAWDPPTSKIPGGSQSAQAVALALGAGGEAFRALTAAALVRAYQASGGSLTVGATGSAYLLGALAGPAGRLDLALSLAERQGLPGWLGEVSNATSEPMTAWEEWGPASALSDGSGNSGMHVFMTGGLTSFIVEHALGMHFSMRGRYSGSTSCEDANDGKGEREVLQLSFGLNTRWGICGDHARSVIALRNEDAASSGSMRLSELIARAKVLLDKVALPQHSLQPRLSLTVDRHALLRLKHAAGWRATPHGNISFSWQLGQCVVTMHCVVQVEVAVPFGVKAVLEVQGGIGGEIILMDGKPFTVESGGWEGSLHHTCGAGLAHSSVEGRIDNAMRTCEPAFVLIPPHGRHTFLFNTTTNTLA